MRLSNTVKAKIDQYIAADKTTSSEFRRLCQLAVHLGRPTTKDENEYYLAHRKPAI